MMRAAETYVIYTVRKGREVHFARCLYLFTDYVVLASCEVERDDLSDFWPTEKLCADAGLTSFVTVPPSARRLNAEDVFGFLRTQLSGLYHYDILGNGFWLQEEQDAVALKMFMA